MNKQNRNDQRSPSSEEARKNAGGAHDVGEGDERIEEDEATHPGAGHHSGSEKPSSPDNRWAPRRNS
jgi:hypothetical protein